MSGVRRMTGGLLRPIMAASGSGLFTARKETPSSTRLNFFTWPPRLASGC
jgi:hypothetical protein